MHLPESAHAGDPLRSLKESSPGSMTGKLAEEKLLGD